MIIELSGIPGSGKSTVFERLKYDTGNKQYIFDVQDYILKNCIFSIRNILYFDCVLLSRISLLKPADCLLLKHSFNIVKNSNNTFFNKINILRNTIKKLIIYRCIIDKDEVFFIDEGVLHIPFNIFVDTSKVFTYEQVKDFLLLIPPVDKLLLIDAPDNTLINRVIKRGDKGHRRINFKSKKSTLIFMERSRNIFSYVRKFNNTYTYNNIYQSIDTKKIFKLIGL